MGNIKQKYTKKQRALLREVEKDPEASNYEIDKKLNTLGVTKSNNYSQQLIRRNTEVASKVAILRERYELQTVKLYPSAKRVVKEALKDNSLDAAKLVFKHALPVIDEAKRPVRQPDILIDQIQAITYNVLEDKIQTLPDDE